MAMISFRSLQQKLCQKVSRKVFKLLRMASAVPSFPVYLSEEEKILRYMVPIESQSSVMFRALLNQFEDEIDLADHAITLPCSAWIFEAVLNLSVDEKHPWRKKEVLNSRNQEGVEVEEEEEEDSFLSRICSVRGNSRMHP